MAKNKKKGSNKSAQPAAAPTAVTATEPEPVVEEVESNAGDASVPLSSAPSTSDIPLTEQTESLTTTDTVESAEQISAESAADNEPAAPEPEPATPAAEPTPEPSATPAPAHDSSSLSLETELAEARAQITLLKQQLEQKEQENGVLRAQVDGKSSAVNLDGSRLGEVQRMQEKLLQLRKEQAEADAAKEAAWKHLKSVVQEVIKLSAPDSKKPVETAA